MNRKTIKALKGSIAKWKRVVKVPDTQFDSPHDCPLCGLFNNDLLMCDGCPVRGATGLLYCGGSPFFGLVRHTGSSDHILGIRKKGCRECIRLAKIELAFLASLLPKKETP